MNELDEERRAAQLPLLPMPRYERAQPLIALRLEGEPQRSKSHPVVGKGQKRAMMVLDPEWRKWRNEMVADIAGLLREMGDDWTGPLTCPVIVGVTAVFIRPQSARRSFRMKGKDRPYPFRWVEGRVPFVGTPDHDQVVKAAVDVCVQAGVLLDDPLVVGYAGGTSRWYAAIGELPHVEVRLWAA